MLPRDEVLAVSERSVLEARIDADVILCILELLELAVCQTEAPVLLVVGGAVRDPVGTVGEGVEMTQEFGKR